MAPDQWLLDRVRIASPCSVPWESMPGDARARYCSHCDRLVFNLSAMNRQEAEDLIRQKQGRLCARYYLRADGKVLTADCSRPRRHVASVAGLALAMLIGMILWLPGSDGTETEESWLRNHEPFRTILNWLTPTTTTFNTVALGSIECPRTDPE